ncbi:hypothetical protein GCM10028812_11260 [Ancylobacter sonchi]
MASEGTDQRDASKGCGGKRGGRATQRNARDWYGGPVRTMCGPAGWRQEDRGSGVRGHGSAGCLERLRGEARRPSDTEERTGLVRGTRANGVRAGGAEAGGVRETRPRARAGRTLRRGTGEAR